MTKNLKKRHLFVAFVAVLILVSMTACKKTTDVPVSDISVDTGATTEVADTAPTTDTATTEATTTATTVTITKAPTTTTRTPNTTAKPVVNQTTKAPTTKATTRATQIDANGREQRIQTPEETCKQNGWTMQEYKDGISKVAVFKCKYCGDHNCPSIVYLIDTNGDYYSLDTNKWKCAAYVASEPKCETCGKKLFDYRDKNNAYLYDDDRYCSGGCGISVNGKPAD